jgi:hypothetical protein
MDMTRPDSSLNFNRASIPADIALFIRTSQDALPEQSLQSTIQKGKYANLFVK